MFTPIKIRHYLKPDAQAFIMNDKPLAVIILGNSERMIGKERLAATFYKAIEQHLIANGFRVEFDDGLPKTCPDLTAALWVAHSRGVDRIRCIPEEARGRFAILGDPDGAIAKDDLYWHTQIMEKYPDSPPPITEQPPVSHFVFSVVMQAEVNRAIRAYFKKR